ncbi:hypothetical protein [Capnocytophaga stomatis]|uniref:DUF3857 domain-containing protein n=1 Tax=Capnocytophaga stomatis TaxID=1848904 RepID=A0ABW8QA92_9FLAO|nr:hypothetical protein [Capnocytophaga stomatis]GIJ97626.1 hypothetical protein CAPN001_21950 [Capnocytophaga stomatis]GIM49483.1 hypothetical protein CAPN003_09350 [Capnocytophaga stomatis]
MQKLIIFLALVGQFLYAQGTTYKAVDGITYKKGDKITLGSASKGTSFQFVYIYKHVSGLSASLRALDALSGGNVTTDDDEKPKPATNNLNHYQGKIIQFRQMTLEDKSKIVNAIVEYKDGYRLIIPMDIALQSREMKSENPDFISISEDIQDNGNLQIKSFSPDFEVNLISVEGNTDSQTVTVNFTIKHKLVHQYLKIGHTSEMLNPRYAKSYDFEGNEYVHRQSQLGSEKNIYGSGVSNKVPTNILIKASITFIKILPEVKEFSFVSIPVAYRDDAGGSYQYNNIEISNVKIDWKK